MPSGASNFTRVALLRQISHRSLTSAPPPDRNQDPASWLKKRLAESLRLRYVQESSPDNLIGCPDNAEGLTVRFNHAIGSAWAGDANDRFDRFVGASDGHVRIIFVTAVRDAFVQASSIPWVGPDAGRRRTGLIARAQRLEARGHIDQAIDLIYDHFDGLARMQNFRACEQLLDETDANELSTDLIVSVLTATLPWKSRLADFYSARAASD